MNKPKLFTSIVLPFAVVGIFIASSIAPASALSAGGDFDSCVAGLKASDPTLSNLRSYGQARFDARYGKVASLTRLNASAQNNSDNYAAFSAAKQSVITHIVSATQKATGNTGYAQTYAIPAQTTNSGVQQADKARLNDAQAILESTKTTLANSNATAAQLRYHICKMVHVAAVYRTPDGLIPTVSQHYLQSRLDNAYARLAAYTEQDNSVTAIYSTNKEKKGYDPDGKLYQEVLSIGDSADPIKLKATLDTVNVNGVVKTEDAKIKDVNDQIKASYPRVNNVRHDLTIYHIPTAKKSNGTGGASPPAN